MSTTSSGTATATAAPQKATSFTKANQSMPKAQAQQVSRKKNTTVCRPIVYGSIAFFLGRKADEYNTHRWSIFVRGLHCEDLSYFIKKVVISLHPSFPNPVRVIEEPPFEVTETGWGEFEIGIQIHFLDPAEPPIDIAHALRLYPPGNQAPSTKKPVLHEVYDELLFVEPSDFMYKKLMAGPEKEAPKHPLAEWFTNFTEEEDLRSIKGAELFVEQELGALKDRLATAEIRQKQLRDEITELTAK